MSNLPTKKRNAIDKQEKGALLFGEAFNLFIQRMEILEENVCESSKNLFALRRRLTVLEERSDFYSYKLSIIDNVPTIEMACIACETTFYIPEKEAKALDFLHVCPKCRMYALPAVARNGEKYRSQDIARMLERPISTVQETARKQGIGRKMGTVMYYAQEDFDRLKVILAGKRRTKKTHKYRGTG